METTLIPLLLSSLALYLFFVFALITGVWRLRPRQSPRRPFVSVVVAARNEERCLPRLLDVLTRQTYESFEIIIVDDRSTDRTSEIVRQFVSLDSRIVPVSIETASTTMPPKKHAVTQGILASHGEILCFTDADCLPTSHWIESLVQEFENNVGIVTGYSLYDPNLMAAGERATGPAGIFQRFLHFFILYEARKVALLSAGSTGLGIPWLCKGSNLAYRRKVWDEVGGFAAISEVLSGDDDLFLQRVVRLTSWGVVHVSSPANIVRSAPPPSFGAFLAQRKRHFSAGIRYPFRIKALIALYHGSNMAVYAGLVLVLFSGEAVTAGIVALGAKLFADSLLLGIAKHPIRRFRLLPVMPFMEIVYILYIVLVGPMGLYGKIEWKN